VENFELACRYIPEDTIDYAACEDTLDSAVCTGRIGAVLLDPVCEGVPYVNSDREPKGTLPEDRACDRSHPDRGTRRAHAEPSTHSRGTRLTIVRRPKSSLSYAMASLAAAVAVSLLAPSIRGAEPAALTDGPLPLGTGKKGGEPCESGAECETGVCKDEKCDPCPSRENCPPPGVCAEKDYQELRGQKGEACGREHSCPVPKNADNDDELDCTPLLMKRANAQACVDARVKIMDDCFMGGNQAHIEALSQPRRAYQKCDGLIEVKMRRNACYQCSEYSDLSTKAEGACSRPTECLEQKVDTKADSQSMRAKIKAAGECRDAQTALAAACFNSNSSERRLEVLRGVGRHEAHCRDVLDFKEGKKLCK